ncbi:MAG: polyketide cyclase/dehydrase [Saprospirales bacterium]|nr:MAG: polyketide cyclase/dehydrase [Saprospirales bacterium]
MKSINGNAPVISRKVININADIEKVWKVLTDIDKWTKWQTDISRAKLNGKPSPGNTFSWKSGGAKINSNLHTVSPFKNFGWTGRAFGMFAIHNWTLTEKDGKVMVFVEESMEGFLAVVFKKAFQNNLEKGMQNWLELLKTECEK